MDSSLPATAVSPPTLSGALGVAQDTFISFTAPSLNQLEPLWYLASSAMVQPAFEGVLVSFPEVFWPQCVALSGVNTME